MNKIKLDKIEDAIKSINNGEIIIVVDDENRENEGDFITAAETINSDKIPKVRMPDLAGKTSLRQAKNMLRANGLVLAEVIERQDPSVEDEVNKPVLDQFLKGEKEAIKPNTEIPRLSKINLVVGVPIRKDTTLLEVDWE